MVISNPNQGTILTVAEVNIYFPICLYNGFILIDSLCHNQLINIKLNLAHKLMKLGPISINPSFKWGVGGVCIYRNFTTYSVAFMYSV